MHATGRRRRNVRSPAGQVPGCPTARCRRRLPSLWPAGPLPVQIAEKGQPREAMTPKADAQGRWPRGAPGRVLQCRAPGSRPARGSGPGLALKDRRTEGGGPPPRTALAAEDVQSRSGGSALCSHSLSRAAPHRPECGSVPASWRTPERVRIAVWTGHRGSHRHPGRHLGLPDPCSQLRPTGGIEGAGPISHPVAPVGVPAFWTALPLVAPIPAEMGGGGRHGCA